MLEEAVTSGKNQEADKEKKQNKLSDGKSATTRTSQLILKSFNVLHKGKTTMPGPQCLQQETFNVSCSLKIGKYSIKHNWKMKIKKSTSIEATSNDKNIKFSKVWKC